MSGRGPHPRDGELFGRRWLEVLAAAVEELSWLLGRGYPTHAALKLVGDRHRLRARQRDALVRSACSDAARDARQSRRLASVAGRHVCVDGFNCLITAEVTLGRGLVLVGRDGAHRDIASIHGSYRRVAHTEAALGALADALEPASAVRWLLDRPVSNSGRLAGMIRRLGEARGAAWEVELHNDPDRVLLQLGGVVATSDAGILDHCDAWVDLPARVVAGAADPWVIRFDGRPAG